MKKIITLLLIAVLVGLLVFTLCACNENYTVVNGEFDFDLMNDFAFQLPSGTKLYCVENYNITEANYSYQNGLLKIQGEFLATLPVGNTEFVLTTNLGKICVKGTVLDKNNSHRIVNSGFETGDLRGWTTKTVFKSEEQIQSFVEEGIRENGQFFTFQADYNGDGRYVYGFDDRDGTDKDKWNERMGILQSSVFVLGGSGYITFKIGGGKNSDLCYLSVRKVADDEEIARFGNFKFNSTNYNYDKDNYFEANLVAYKYDLSQYLGEELYIEACDSGGRDWDLLTLDSINTYYVAEPNGSYEQAVDIRPSFSNIEVSNQVYNGDFSSGLSGWVVSDAKGWSGDAFHVDNGILKSNKNGDESRGLIRSGLFKLEGCGTISLDFGAAQGSRFDKDTYISIKQYKTNREVFRFANNQSNGNTLTTYYINLSEYIGQYLYIEIVDNGTLSWDTVFVDNIVTFYQNSPVYGFGNTGINLNY